MRIPFLTATEGVEQVELTEPWQTALAAGHDPVLVSTDSGAVQTFHHLDKVGRSPRNSPWRSTTPPTCLPRAHVG
jgi:protease I